MKLALLGWPLTFSLSPWIFHHLFHTVGLQGSYELHPTKPAHLFQKLRELERQNYRGVNLTVPLKEQFPPSFSPTETVQKLGAANVLCFSTKKAYNTDVLGFSRDLDLWLGANWQGKVLILGAGGAAKAAVRALKDRECAIAFVNRSEGRSRALQKQFPFVERLSWEEVAQRPFDLIVQATSVGMGDPEVSPWPADVPFPQRAFVYDMIYWPEETLFLRTAKAQGAEVRNGLGMLFSQAVYAFEIWQGQWMDHSGLIQKLFQYYTQERPLCSR